MSSTATLDRPDGSRSGTAAASAETSAKAGGSPPGGDGATGCPKCGNPDSWGTASWCPQCGYYPRLGTSVSPDAAAAATGQTQQGPASHLEALARLPRWAYILAGGIVAIFFMSVAVRVITPDDSLSRSLWSLMQLFVGGSTFLAMHTYAFLRAGAKGGRIGGFDIVIHPIEVWRPSFQELPASSRRIWAGAWGLMAASCAILIIGGIRYSALTDDWGFKERPKQNLLKKIKDQMIANAQEAEKGADNLEDAINDFAGDDDAKKKADAKKKESELQLLSADCVVVGYNVDQRTGAIRDLVLATIVDDKLQYAGLVTGEIPPEVQEQLRDKLPRLVQQQPFLKCPVAATWVKPVVTCRTSFKSWTDTKRMQQPKVQELLADMDAR